MTAWYVASVPLWFLGAWFFIAAIWGIVKIGRNPDNCPEDAGLMRGVLSAFLGSTLLLILAAWVSS